MKVCMIVPEKCVKGGIATVVNGYRKTDFGDDIEIIYVESYCDGSKVKKLKKALLGYAAYAKVLIFNKPQIVHIHSSFGPSFYRKMPFILMAHFFKIKIINHIHGADFDSFYIKASERRKKLVRKIYNLCDRIVVLSEEWKKNIEMIVDKQRITVVENYCIIPEESNRRKKRQILFLGEISERKGGYDLANIYQKIVEETGPIPLIIAGDGQMKEVKETFVRLGIEKEVSFPGWVRGRKKESLLEESEFFLFPTYNEGMPMAVLEAMAHEMAIVTTNVGGIPKLIEDGKEGFLCEPGDVKRMAEKMSILIKDEKVKQLCGKNAKEKAMFSYGLEKHLTKIQEIYKEESSAEVGV